MSLEATIARIAQIQGMLAPAAPPPAAPPPMPGIAIGTAAAALTPSSDSSALTSCDSSRTLMPLM